MKHFFGGTVITTFFNMKTEKTHNHFWYKFTDNKPNALGIVGIVVKSKLTPKKIEFQQQQSVAEQNYPKQAENWYSKDKRLIFNLNLISLKICPTDEVSAIK